MNKFYRCVLIIIMVFNFALIAKSDETLKAGDRIYIAVGSEISPFSGQRERFITSEIGFTFHNNMMVGLSGSAVHDFKKIRFPYEFYPETLRGGITVGTGQIGLASHYVIPSDNKLKLKLSFVFGCGWVRLRSYGLGVEAFFDEIYYLEDFGDYYSFFAPQFRYQINLHRFFRLDLIFGYKFISGAGFHHNGVTFPLSDSDLSGFNVGASLIFGEY